MRTDGKFKRLTEAEVTNKRVKGLCFRCDEKFAQGIDARWGHPKVYWFVTRRKRIWYMRWKVRRNGNTIIWT